MASYELGDLVVLSAGSMRMAVEAVDGDQIAVVWCHEGEIGRDSFHAKLLRKWEVREDDHGSRGRPHRSGGSDRGDRGGPRGGGDRDRGGDRDDRPRGKTGWDGKPREKKYFRKD